MKANIFHNVTQEDGRVAIFARSGEQRVKPGDELQFVGSLDLPNIYSAIEAAELAFEIGNSPADIAPVRRYRSWKVRSLSAGDVVTIEDDTHHVVAFDCRPTGWALTDLTLFKLIGGPEGTTVAKTDTDRANLNAALALIREHCPGAVAVHLQTSDQNRYGFTLMSVEYKPGEATGAPIADSLLPDEIEDEVSDLLSDLDWDSVVGESPHGYARIPLPKAVSYRLNDRVWVYFRHPTKGRRRSLGFVRTVKTRPDGGWDLGVVIQDLEASPNFQEYTVDETGRSADLSPIVER